MRNGKRLDSDRRPPTDTFGAFRKPPFNNMDAIIYLLKKWVEESSPESDRSPFHSP